MTREIAIITCDDVCFDRYGDEYGAIPSSITEWTTVSEEEYGLLKKAQRYDHRVNFYLIEKPDQDRFIKKTIKDYLEYARSQEEKRLLEQQKKEEAAEKRRQKKLEKEFKTKQALFESLKKELSPDV